IPIFFTFFPREFLPLEEPEFLQDPDILLVFPLGVGEKVFLPLEEPDILQDPDILQIFPLGVGENVVFSLRSRGICCFSLGSRFFPRESRKILTPLFFWFSPRESGKILW
ncbi:hypothetical protein L9F63_012219, partial [Diploptera punctata]